MPKNEIKSGVYRHYKGSEYMVLGTAQHSETGEELVVYQSLADDKLWVRPKDIFLQFVHVNGKKVPRFKYISK